MKPKKGVVPPQLTPYVKKKGGPKKKSKGK
jgi:hypothetical protein